MKTASGDSFDAFLEDMRPFFHGRSLVYVDVGAYDGATFERLLDKHPKVREAFLVEPNPASMRRARERMGDRFSGKRLHFLEVALGAEVGTVSFLQAEDMSRVVAARTDGLAVEGLVQAECTTLDRVAEQLIGDRISLLKIDAEGSELQILDGARDLLNRQQVDVIYIEAGFDPNSNQQTYYRSIEDALAGFGYRVFRIYEQKHEWTDDSPILRRVNFAFMSRDFSAANPYRLSMELFELQTTISSLREEHECVRIERDKLLQEARRHGAERTELIEQIGELRRRGEFLSAQLEQRVALCDELRKQQQSVADELETLKSRLDAARTLADQSEKERRAAERRLNGRLAADSRRFSGLEVLLEELVGLIPQMHRRELAALKQATSLGAALEELRSSPEYILGQTVSSRSRRHLGVLRQARALVADLRVLESNRCESATGQSVSEAAIVPRASFTAQNTSLGVPLTLSPYRVVVPPQEHEMTVWATLLASDWSARASLRYSVRLSEPDETIGSGSPGPDAESPEESNGNLWLTSGRAKRMLRIPPCRSPVEIVYHRVRGSFGVLKLELRHAAEPVVVSPVETGSVTGPVSELDKRVRGNESDLSSLVFLRRLSATELERKLWGGYARYALPALEALKSDVTATSKNRESAAWSLARWHFVEERYDLALENIAHCRALMSPVRARVTLCEAQCYVRLGRLGRADKVLVEACARSDLPDFRLIRSAIARDLAIESGRSLAEAEAVQLRAINEVLLSAGLAPILKRDPAKPMDLSNIRAEAAAEVGPQAEMVSVIIPGFNAEDTIGWVLDSILEQTWRNIEVIVVDDMSLDATCAVVESVAARDARVKLIRNERNLGAYATRNAGMLAATGEYVMVHDSDDWSHPQRIELQVKALLARPGCIAVKSHWVRVGFNLEILGAWIPRGSVFDLNFSSLLFRRSLLDQVGYWDEVSVSGDAEFYSRLQALFGMGAVHKIPKQLLLAFSLTREDSLTRSRSTHLRSLQYGLRWNYRDAYLSWHSRLRPGDAPSIARAFVGGRPFPVPIGNRTRDKEVPKYDLLVVADFSDRDRSFELAIATLEEAAAAGLRAAIFHYRRYERPSHTSLQDVVYDTCLRLGIDIVGAGDSIRTELLLFASPDLLQYLLEPFPCIDTARVMLVGYEDDPVTMESLMDYRSEIVRANLACIVAVEAEWVSPEFDIGSAFGDRCAESVD